MPFDLSQGTQSAKLGCTHCLCPFVEMSIKLNTDRVRQRTGGNTAQLRMLFASWVLRYACERSPHGRAMHVQHIKHVPTCVGQRIKRLTYPRIRASVSDHPLLYFILASIMCVARGIFWTGRTLYCLNASRACDLKRSSVVETMSRTYHGHFPKKNSLLLVMAPPSLGDSRIVHGEEMRCFHAGVRSSQWITHDGAWREIHHDTNHVSPIHAPSCDEHGALRGFRGQRIERLIAMAWLLPTTNGVACLREEQQGPVASNLMWKPYRGTLGCHSESESDDGVRADNSLTCTLPPCVQRAAHAAAVYSSVDDIANECDISVGTAWNYVCKAASHIPAVISATDAQRLVHPEVFTIVGSVDCNGPLAPVVHEVRERLSETVEHLYSHVRMARIAITMQRNAMPIMFVIRN